MTLKDQTNLIVVIVAIVFMIGFSLAFALTQRKPLTIPDPPVVPVAAVKTQEGAVIYANALPGASAGGAGGVGGGAATSRGGAGRGGADGGRTGGGGPAPSSLSSAGK
ncbi:MAG: hypothetical protein ACKVQS_01585 [Fimbriimonadaceae bacterium]